ncbi:MAG: hypothetical protein P9X24_09140 [Candidatus Hatepunaea meridiana]|nr:hypothetical protein [Candidatus Hatepunaea meridiana]
MQLIFSDPYYDSSEWQEDKFLNELNGNLQEFDEQLVAQNADIGHGADWPCVLVELFNDVDWKTIVGASAVSIFLLGDKINKNLEAWEMIFRKFSVLISKFKPTRIDEQAAICMVVCKLKEKGVEISNIEIALQVIPFTPGAVQGRSKLEETPDALYVISAKFDDKAYVFGIKSNGNHVFQHEFHTSWMKF